jgi:hypothetical protein
MTQAMPNEREDLDPPGNPFDYLVELQRHKVELAADPPEGMPWTYRETLGRITIPAAG